jgi:hypothetical protein
MRTCVGVMGARREEAGEDEDDDEDEDEDEEGGLI